MVHLFSAFVGIASATNAPLATPMLGWSTWNQLRGNFNASVLQSIARAMNSSGLRAFGYTYFNVDDLWASSERDAASGEMTADPAKFPDGMASFGEWLHSNGFQLGLYTARYNRTCSGKMPGSLGFEAVDAATFSRWGVDFLKNDDCRVVYANAVRDYGAMQRALARVERPILHAVKAPDLPPSAARAVAQMRRVGKDLKNSWSNVMRLVDTGVAPAFERLAGPGFFNDFDMLFVGVSEASPSGDAQLTETEQRSHFSLWSALKSPIVLGNDPRSMSAATRAILLNADVLAVNQDRLAAPVRRLPRNPAAAALHVPRDGDKLYLERCDARLPSQRWALARRNANATLLSLRSNATGANSSSALCAGVYKCLDRWPWLITLGACAGSARSGPSSKCTPNARSQWVRVAADSDPHRVGFRLQWSNVEAGKSGWPSSGASHGGSCLSTEGSNVEVDVCDWPADATQQEWFEHVDAASGATQIVSAHSGLCLASIGGADRYVGPLAAGAATAVLLNRASAPLTITLSMNEVRSVVPDFAAPAVEVRPSGEARGAARRAPLRVEATDLWTKATTAVDAADGLLSYVVPSHAAVHVRMQAAVR